MSIIIDEVQDSSLESGRTKNRQFENNLVVIYYHVKADDDSGHFSIINLQKQMKKYLKKINIF